MEQIKVFKQEIKIGDKFMYNRHTKAEIVDIFKTYSTATGERGNDIFIAKGINSLSTNTFEVCKVTVIRNRID